MPNKYGASEVAGPGSGKGKVAARRAARKESGMSAQKYYVQTRMAEADKSGKTLDRAALRKKFQSGDVARKGFGAPPKRSSSSSSSSSSSKKTDTSPTTDSSSRRGYQSPTSRTTSTSTKRGTGYRSADAYGSSTGPVTRSVRRISKYKSKYDKSENRVGKFIKNELLGVDDFKRVGKYIKSGEYGKAAKSAGAGVFELGSSALTVTGVGGAAKAASAAAKGASVASKASKAAKTAKTAAAASRSSKATKAAAATKATKARAATKSSKVLSGAATAARETAKGRVVLKGGQIGSAALVRSGDKNKNKSKPNPYLK